MKTLKILGISLILFVQGHLWAKGQDEEKKYPITKPIVKVYGNYHFGLNEFSKENAFELTRAYLGFRSEVSNHISFKTNLDFGKPLSDSKYDYVAYLKTAELKYHKGKFQLSAGLIGLKQFKLQEKIWAHRYVYKSFQDEHKFGPSADFGAILEYQVIDGLFIDATFRNGEGYKKMQSDRTFNGALGLTFHFGESIVFRSSYDYSKKSVAQGVYSGFLGYQYKSIILFGIEYNYMSNSKYVENQNLKGISTYVTYIMNEKMQLFARYDNLSSNKLDNSILKWNILNDGQAVIGGLQFTVNMNVKLSGNMQNWLPADDSSDDQMYFFMNFEYKL